MYCFQRVKLKKSSKIELIFPKGTNKVTKSKKYKFLGKKQHEENKTFGAPNNFVLLLFIF